MKLILGKWCFCPKLLTSFITILLMYLFVSLGLWQLDRAEQKKTLFTNFENRRSAEAINFNLDKNNQLDKDSLVWRKIEASGEFLNNYQILLDNRVHEGQAGYYVYTPFKLSSRDKIVLINRGWVSSDMDRAAIPKIIITEGIVSIHGLIKAFPKTGVLLKETKPEKLNDNIYRVQNINLETMGTLTKSNLLPYVVRLEPESEHGYLKSWSVPGSDENMHKGYAFQWFAFALVLTGIYLFLNIKKVKP